MVKNKKGGSGHKKMARKNVAPKGGYASRRVRLPKEEGEMIARITSMNGGGHASIRCTDGKNRTLVIRGKFSGRNKRDNFLRVNTLVLVGLRSVTMGAVVNPKKKEKADILEIYPDNAKKVLQEIPEVYAILDDVKKQEIQDDSAFEITNDATDSTQDSTQDSASKKEAFKDDAFKDDAFKKEDWDVFKGDDFTEEDWDNI